MALSRGGLFSFRELETLMQVIRLAGAIALVTGCLGAANAQTPAETTVERSIKALANRDTEIGMYLNVLPDCTSGPLPTIRLVRPPIAGKVVVKSAKAKATN